MVQSRNFRGLESNAITTELKKLNNFDTFEELIENTLKIFNEVASTATRKINCYSRKEHVSSKTIQLKFKRNALYLKYKHFQTEENKMCYQGTKKAVSSQIKRDTAVSKHKDSGERILKWTQDMWVSQTRIKTNNQNLV